MKRIVIITNMMSFYRLDFFNKLVENRNYDFHIIFSAEKETNNRNWEINHEKLNFKYTILESKEIIKPGKGIKETRIINITKNVFKVLDKINPDIIIGSEYNPTIIKAFIYSKIRRKKYISWSDGTLNSERFISFPQKMVRRVICLFSNYFIASSTETKEAQIKYGANPEKISISFLTIDVEGFIEKLTSFHEKDHNIPRILFCGYLLKLKGLDFLFEALKDVKSDFVLDIIGSGIEEAHLKKIARECKIENIVNFLGYKNRTEITIFYKNADIFVFPGLNDAFGLVLVEALAAGLPLISSIYAGGSKDVIENDVNGFIIDPKNTDDFRNKLEILLSDRNLRMKMGKDSLKRAQRFYLKEVVNGFYEAIIKC